MATQSLSNLFSAILIASLFTGVLSGSVNAQESDDWRKKLGKFRIGVVGGNRPILKNRQVQPFREVLQKALGIPVEVFAARDHQTLIDAIAGSRIEYATFSATAFAAAWQLCKCVEPVAVPVASDGSTGFRSVLLARYLGPGSLAALKNKTVIIPGKNSFSGFLYPKKALLPKGVKLGAPDWPVDDKSNTQSALSAFIGGEGDAILGWIPEIETGGFEIGRGTLHDLEEASAGEAVKFRTLWKSEVIPHGPHTMRRNVPRQAKQIISKILLGLSEKNAEAYDAIEPGMGGGFRPVVVDDYEPLIQILAKPDIGKKSD